jgi:hypothetical protein
MRLRRFLITEPMNFDAYLPLITRLNPVTLPKRWPQTENRASERAALPTTSVSLLSGSYLAASVDSTTIYPASKYDVSSRSCTALACTRNERPTRTAGSSPLCTSR